MRQNPIMALAVAAENVLAEQASREGSLDIDSRLQLFVDDYLVDELHGTRLVLHHPRPAGVALRFDRPWEGAFCAYVTVLHVGDIYRMYYRGQPNAMPDGSFGEVTCYAESRDGIHWEKPDLGLFEVAGTRKNNVVLGSEYAPVPTTSSRSWTLGPGFLPPRDTRAWGACSPYPRSSASATASWASPPRTGSDGGRSSRHRE